MRTIFLFLACLPLTAFSQFCEKRCGFQHDVSRENSVQFFQSSLMNKYDIKYLKLDLNVETASRAISGSSITRAIALVPVDSFAIEFKNNMVVDSIFINGTKRTFTRRDDHIFVGFPTGSPLPAGSTIEAITYYKGNANAIGVFAGTVGSIGLNYTAILSESYQAREWFPAKQILSDKIDSTDIWITTSATNKAGCNGLLKATVTLPSGKVQYQWSTRYPMAYYHPSFSVGNYMEYVNYAAPAAMAPTTIPVLHYIANNNAYFNTNKANLDKTPVFIEKMSELFGLYPFSKEKYGHAQANIGGGMEQQTMSTMSSFGTGLIAHELGHQWFGNNVTCATWNHIWINEGFASYADYLMNEQLPALYSGSAASAMQGIHSNVMSSAGGSVFVTDAEIFDENRIFSGRLSYDKGAAIIHTLRFELQSDNLFFQILRQFQQQYKDKVATADDFKAVAENLSGKSFTNFFNQWYYGQGFPTYSINYYTSGDSLTMTVTQTTSSPANTSFFNGLVEYTIQSAAGDTTVKFNLNSNGQQFRFKYTKEPTGIVIDPNNWIINRTGTVTRVAAPPVDPPVDPGTPPIVFEPYASPNPSTGSFIIRYPVNVYKEASLFDMQGRLMQRLILAQNSNQQTINTILANGVYLLKLTGGGKSKTIKVLLVR